MPIFSEYAIATYKYNCRDFVYEYIITGWAVAQACCISLAKIALFDDPTLI